MVRHRKLTRVIKEKRNQIECGFASLDVLGKIVIYLVIQVILYSTLSQNPSAITLNMLIVE